MTDGLASPYWGIQKLEVHSDALVEVMRSGERYVDLTAGGGTRVFEEAKYHPVHGNDRNAYAAAAFTAAGFLQEASTRELSGFKTYAAPKYREDLGYLTRNRGTDKVPDLSRNVAGYIDSLCSEPVAGYLATRVLVNQYTVRARKWDKTPEKTMTVDRFYDLWLEEVYQFVEQVTSRFPITGSNSDAAQAEEFVKPGDVVYTDPAWPWATDPNLAEKGYVVTPEEQEENPYTFLTCAIGSIYKQEEVLPETVGFWTANNPERVFEDVTSWMIAAFEAGATKFILSTQSTNSPPPEQVYPQLEVMTGHKLDMVEQQTAKSVRSGTEYEDFFGVYLA